MGKEKEPRTVDCRLCKKACIYSEQRYRDARILGCTERTRVINSYLRVCTSFKFDANKAEQFRTKLWYKNYYLKEKIEQKKDITYPVDALPEPIDIKPKEGERR